MGIEIERKFLVTSEHFKDEACRRYEIKQGFLNSHKNRTVRIRVLEAEGYLTIKGKSSDNGLSRYEWETRLTKDEAEILLTFCEDSIIEKERYEIKAGDHLFEVDVFHGQNEGLIVAEVELASVTENFERPEWLGKEVTGDIRYYNARLSSKPFMTWTE
jgi:adenylate cyclase